MITIKRIGVGSAFRIGALVSALFSFIVLGLFGLLQISLWTSLVGLFDANGQPLPQDAGFFGLAGTAGFLLLFVCGVVFYAIVGGLSSAILALIYNFVARQFGGLELEFDGLRAPSAMREQKQKNSSFFDSDFES